VIQIIHLAYKVYIEEAGTISYGSL